MLRIFCTTFFTPRKEENDENEEGNNEYNRSTVITEAGN